MSDRSSSGMVEHRSERISRPDGSSGPDSEKRLTGFALLTAEMRVEMARKGGKAAQQSPDARRWTSETARAAGRLGGRAVHQKQRQRVAAAQTP
jgi:uncharacterized protein